MNESRQVRRAAERAAQKGRTPTPSQLARAAPKRKTFGRPNGERLVAAALIRDGVTESRGFKEHWRIRAAMGDADPYEKNPADRYGFLTSTGRFVDRGEAMLIGAEAGQCQRMARELLSSDIDWEGRA